MAPKVSIIVPIYNVAPFIERCARSLMEQTFSECEFVFVDDASPDDSIDILKKVISNYPSRISCVHILQNQQNRGLAETRFIGMNAAQGEYILHCDSDDWVEHDMVEIMYGQAVTHHADIVMCEASKEYSQHSEPLSFENDIETWENGLLALKFQEQHVAIWNKLIRRALFDQHAIKNYPGINMSEDSALTVRLRYFSNKTVIVHKRLYHYNRMNRTSMCSSFSLNYTKQLIELAKNIETFFVDENKYEQFKHVINYYKFISKQSILKRLRNYNAWRDVFPESHVSILRFRHWKWSSRLKWWLCAYCKYPSTWFFRK